MKTEYYELIPGELYVAKNHKVATSSIAKASAFRYRREIYDALMRGCNKDQPYAADMFYRYDMPKTESPTGEIILIVRPWKERFISAGGDVGKLGSEDPHYQLQSDFKYTKLFHFNDLVKFAEYCDLPTLEHINVNRIGKVEPSTEDLAIAELFYAKDIALERSIT